MKSPDYYTINPADPVMVSKLSPQECGNHTSNKQALGLNRASSRVHPSMVMSEWKHTGLAFKPLSMGPRAGEEVRDTGRQVSW